MFPVIKVMSKTRVRLLVPGVDGVESQEVEDILAGVCGEFGGERAGLEAEAGRGKVMSHRANKLQMPFLANSIYSSDRLLERSINSCVNQINSCRH